MVREGVAGSVAGNGRMTLDLDMRGQAMKSIRMNEKDEGAHFAVVCIDRWETDLYDIVIVIATQQQVGPHDETINRHEGYSASSGGQSFPPLTEQTRCAGTDSCIPPLVLAPHAHFPPSPHLSLMSQHGRSPTPMAQRPGSGFVTADGLYGGGGAGAGAGAGCASAAGKKGVASNIDGFIEGTLALLLRFG